MPLSLWHTDRAPRSPLIKRFGLSHILSEILKPLSSADQRAVKRLNGGKIISKALDIHFKPKSRNLLTLATQKGMARWMLRGDVARINEKEEVWLGLFHDFVNTLKPRVPSQERNDDLLFALAVIDLFQDLSELPNMIEHMPKHEVRALKAIDVRNETLGKMIGKIDLMSSSAHQLLRISKGLSILETNPVVFSVISELETKTKDWTSAKRALKSSIWNYPSGRTEEHWYKLKAYETHEGIRLWFNSVGKIRPLAIDEHLRRDVSLFEKAAERSSHKCTPLRILANGAYLFGVAYPKCREENLRKAIAASKSGRVFPKRDKIPKR